MGEYKLPDGSPLPTHQFADYQKSIHFTALTKNNDLSAPTCTDCQGNHGAVPPGVGSIANICGTCHAVFQQKFEGSVHQQIFDKGCVECHGNHAVLKPSDEMLGATGHAVCATCHSGADDKGAMQPRGKYLAELTYRDANGKALHKSETYFVHDSEAMQRKNFAEVEGQLSMEAASGAGISANTTVELVDGDGKVVQRAMSTAQGNYRFKAVPKGSYKVRASRDGFKTQESAIKAEPNAPAAKADMKMH